MKKIIQKILSGIVAFIMLLSSVFFVGLALAALAGVYSLFVMMTHHLIHNLWIEIPIDICTVGVIYSVMKMSREYL